MFRDAAALVGRLLLCAIFVMSGIAKLTAWGETARQMEAQGIPYVDFLLPAAAAVELGGGLLVLFGLWTRLGALALIGFLIPTTLLFHDFWNYTGPAQQGQMINFMKNLAIMGGLFTVAGSGRGGTASTQCARGTELCRRPRRGGRPHEARAGGCAGPGNRGHKPRRAADRSRSWGWRLSASAPANFPTALTLRVRPGGAVRAGAPFAGSCLSARHERHQASGWPVGISLSGNRSTRSASASWLCPGVVGGRHV